MPRWIRQVACATALAAATSPALAQDKPAAPAVPGGATAKKKGEPEPPLPPIEARLWIIAPSPQEAWTLRIDNEGQLPVRVPADVRLLRFEIEKLDPKDPKRRQKLKCGAPDALRPKGFPEARALLLAPGESYVETFDPRLLCFGKDAAAITGGTRLVPALGWAAPPKGVKKRPDPPYAAEGTDYPPSRTPATVLYAPTMMLSYAPAKPRPPEEEEAAPATDAKKDDAAKPPLGPPKPTEEAKGKEAADAAKPEIVDANAPRLEVTTSAYADASSPSRVSVTVTATNVGHRPMLAALRARMLSFKVQGPDGTITCAAHAGKHGLPRDAYRTYKPGASTSFTVLLGEVCPDNTFHRAGLYRVTPTLHATESGAADRLGAYTAELDATSATLVRVQAAPEPYYKTPPKALRTTELEPSAESD